ncbi:MAG: pilin [Patescibacteria group bacterium]|jgi:hypothetical protein
MRLRKFFLFTFTLLVFGISAGFAGDVLAQEFVPEPIKTEIAIPIADRVEGYTGNTVADLANYIGVIYQFMISIIGLVAAVMMIIGGFQYLTSAGDSGKIGAARKRIVDALIGLVLAFSAYLLLNTINPDLLRFKPIGTQLAQVKTETLALPWCEDLINQGLEVTSLMTVLECGAVGVYKNQGNELPCIYYGKCQASRQAEPEGRFDDVWNTCLQVLGGFGDKGYVRFPPSVYITASKNNKDDVLFGQCTTCAEITSQGAKDLGYQSLSEACSMWDRTINTEINKLYGSGSRYWSYCAQAGNSIDGEGFVDSCLQFDIDCQAADSNEDVGAGSCGNDCGCEGYDDSPTPRYALKKDANGQVTRIGTSDNTPDGISPANLGKLCGRNPCREYTNSSTQKQNFINNCTYEGELSSYITTDFNIDCRNR